MTCPPTVQVESGKGTTSAWSGRLEAVLLPSTLRPCDACHAALQVENGKGAMPAWSGRLDSDEIESVAEYVFKQVGAGWAEAGVVGQTVELCWPGYESVAEYVFKQVGGANEDMSC